MRIPPLIFLTICLCLSSGHAQGTNFTECNISMSSVELELPATDAALINYLNQGGDPHGLEAVLIQNNRIGQRIAPDSDAPIPYWARNRGGVYIEDIDQNGFLDVIVAVSFIENGGGIYIFGCKNDHYEKIAEITEQDFCAGDCMFDLYTPKVLFIGDMNMDDFPELVYEIAYSGITTRWMDIRIETWGTIFDTIFQLNRDPIEYPSDVCGASEVGREFPDGTVTVRDVNDDHLLDLIVQTGCSGSISAGPQRSQQLIFEWNGDEYLETGYNPDPPRYRLHEAYDALYALNQSDAVTALVLYDAVITDEQLEDWGGYDIAWIVTSHALYGKLLSTVAIYGSSSSESEQAFEQVVHTAAASNLSDTLWITMTELLWTELSQNISITSACEAVNDALTTAIHEASPYLYGLNEIGYWPQFGYNVNWVPTEHGLSMCPL